MRSPEPSSDKCDSSIRAQAVAGAVVAVPCWPITLLRGDGGLRVAHRWGRQIGRLGHEVRLIAPAYVKPFVKRQKNDMADAEAIAEAASRPTMRFLAVKSAEKQAAG